MCWFRVREIVLSLAGHFKLFAGHLIEFNHSSSPDIFEIRWTCPASLATFAYSEVDWSTAAGCRMGPQYKLETCPAPSYCLIGIILQLKHHFLWPIWWNIRKEIKKKSSCTFPVTGQGKRIGPACVSQKLAFLSSHESFHSYHVEDMSKNLENHFTEQYPDFCLFQWVIIQTWKRLWWVKWNDFYIDQISPLKHSKTNSCKQYTFARCRFICTCSFYWPVYF